MKKDISNIPESDISKSGKSNKNNAKSGISSDDKKDIHEGHRKRMRRRFIESDGFKGFEEHQVLELILFYSIPRRDTNDYAHMLIDKFGSLAKVVDASYESLTELSFVNENTAVLLKMLPAFMSVYHKSSNKKESYNNTEKLIGLFKSDFAGSTHEEFRIACFNVNLELICDELISSGSPTGSSVDMRKLMEIVVKSNAVSIAVAHNHPNGDPTPSNSDISVTRQIDTLTKGIGVSLLDHIIVGENQSISLRNKGYITFFG